MTAVAPRPRALDMTALAVIGLHPMKIAILEHVATHGNEPVAPKDIAEVIGENLGSTSYHIRQLVEKGLLRLVRTEPRRGALQHFYVVTDLGLLSGDKEAHARLRAGANGRVRDAGEMLFRLCARTGVILESVEWAEAPEEWRMAWRRAGQEVFGVA